MKKEINKLQNRYPFLCPYFWRDLKYKISCLFKHRNPWVNKAIAREWRDLDHIYEEILFAGIINYVEGEECFKKNTWINPEEIIYKRQIEKIYHWAKTGRYDLQKQINNAYPSFDDNFSLSAIKAKTYNELYGEVNRLEKILRDTNTKHLVWLVKNRGILWT